MAVSIEEVVYLDYNATTPVLPEVVEAMLPYLTQRYGNPPSEHVLGRQAAQAVGAARDQVRRAARVRGRGDRVHLRWDRGEQPRHPRGSGGRGRASTADRHFGRRAPRHRRAPHAAGHHRLADHNRPGHLHRSRRRGHGRDQDGPGCRSRHRHARAKRDRRAHADRRVRAAARAAGALVHTDAAQAVGKIPVDVDIVGVDLLLVAGHKCYAVKGVGALYIRRGTPVHPVLRGAGQERGLRPGTENVAGIVGLGAACEILQASLASEAPGLTMLREQLWAGLARAFPGLVRLTPLDRALPNPLLVSFPQASGRDVLAVCPTVAAATGSACHAGQEHPSEAVLAMGVDPRTAAGTVRLSLGRGTSAADVERASAGLAAAA